MQTNYKWTRFYEDNAVFEKIYPQINIAPTEYELVICSTVIDTDNYSILTTLRLFTKENGIEHAADLAGARNKLYGDFKGTRSQPFTFGIIQTANGADVRYFIETGKASMIMIYGVKTLINIQ